MNRSFIFFSLRCIMFWTFMNKVHGLPTPERSEDEPWWNDDEKKILDFVVEQLSYSHTEGVVTLVQEKGLTQTDDDFYTWCCIQPTLQNQEDQLVFGLDKEWTDFLSKHVDIGTYIGSVSDNMTDFCFICRNCGEEFDEEYQEELDENDSTNWMYDSVGFGRRFDGTVKQKIENKACCPECKTECELALFDDCDIDTIWIFEKGSIIFCHYGRGAGISFKFHSSINMEGKEPMKYFSDVVNSMMVDDV